MDEFPDPDEEYEMMHADELEMMREMNGEMSLRMAPRVMSFYIEGFLPSKITSDDLVSLVELHSENCI